MQRGHMISATYRKLLITHLRLGVAMCLLMALSQLAFGWGSALAMIGGVMVALFSSSVLVCVCTVIAGGASTRSTPWVAAMAIIKLPLLLGFLYLISRSDRDVFWSGILGALSVIPAVVLSGLMTNMPRVGVDTVPEKGTGPISSTSHTSQPQ